MAGPSPQVAQALSSVSQKYNVPLWFLYAVAQRESSFDPNAVNNWDTEAGSGWPGRGLFQITGQDSASPQFAAYGNASNDLGFNKFGQWVDPKTVPYMSNIFDPYQNAERFVSSFAAPWYNYQKQQNPGLSSDQLWDRVAFNWNAGLFSPYDANRQYLTEYRYYAQDFAKQFGGSYTGDPSSQLAPGGGTPGPAQAAHPALNPTQQALPGQDIYPGSSGFAPQPMTGRDISRVSFPGLFGGYSMGQNAFSTGFPGFSGFFGGSTMGQSTLGMRSPFSYGSLGRSASPSQSYRDTGSSWLDYYNRIFNA